MSRFLALLLFAVSAAAQPYSFTLPKGWVRLAKTSSSGCVLLVPQQDSLVSICGHHTDPTTETVEHALRVSPDELIQQYRTHEIGESAHLRSNSVAWSRVAGQMALSAIVDYSRGNKDMSELIVWLQSDATRMHVKVRVPQQTDMDSVRRLIQPLLNSIRVE